MDGRPQPDAGLESGGKELVKEKTGGTERGLACRGGEQLDMSVFIKGMQMPVDCDSCKVADIIDCMLWLPTDCGERHPECPMVDVKIPHGRLIDSDHMISKITPDPVTECGCPEPEWLGEFTDLLATEETVIESEE